MKKSNTALLVFMSLAVVINIIGAYIALLAKLPIYLDSMGTILSAILLGPLCGAVVGGMSSLINGATFDPVSFYFLPVQLLVGALTGILFRHHKFEGLRSVIAIILITILGASISSIIAGIVFNGVTSSGSSLIVAVLKNSGMNVITAVFSTQIFTDLLDKFLSFGIVFAVIKALPAAYKEKLMRDEKPSVAKKSI